MKRNILCVLCMQFFLCSIVEAKSKSGGTEVVGKGKGQSQASGEQEHVPYIPLEKFLPITKKKKAKKRTVAKKKTSLKDVKVASFGKTISDFVPKGWELYHKAKGKLLPGSSEQVAMIIKVKREGCSNQVTYGKKLLILTKHQLGWYLHSRIEGNPAVVDCLGGVAINKKILEVSRNCWCGFSNSKQSTTWKVQYRKNKLGKEGFYLIAKYATSYSLGGGPADHNETYTYDYVKGTVLKHNLYTGPEDTMFDSAEQKRENKKHREELEKKLKGKRKTVSKLNRVPLVLFKELDPKKWAKLVNDPHY